MPNLLIQKTRLIFPPPRWPIYTLLIILISYNLFFIAYSLQKHFAFQTAGFDLGVWDQMIWNTLHGRPFWTTQHENILRSLAFHVEPVILFLFPLYGLYSGPEIMIIFQTFIVSLGALPVYWLAKDKLKTPAAGLVFACVYLLYPALGAAVTFDVHSLTIAVPFLAYVLWAMYTERYRLFLVMALLAISCKEDMPLIVFMMGTYILVGQRNYKIGLITMAVSLSWFIVAISIVIPTFRPDADNEYVYRYLEWGDSMGEIMVAIITNPWRVIQVITQGDKALYWFRFTLPVFFIALFDPLTLFMAAPTMLINTLGNYPAAYQLDLFHSSAPLAVFVTFAAINGAARLSRLFRPRSKYVSPHFFRNLLIILILVATLMYQLQFGHTPIGRYFKWPTVTEHHLKAEEMMRLIPSQAVVASQNGLATRLSQRQWLFILPNTSYKDIKAEYIAMDMQGNLDIHGSVKLYCDQINDLLKTPDYGLIFAKDGLLLFQQDVPDTATFNPMSPCLL